MPGWPPIAEPELLRRLKLDDAEFTAFLRELVAQLPARECDEAAIAQALAYPWVRPAGSYLLRGGEFEALAGMAAAERESTLSRFADPAGDRLPLLAIGSNGAPTTLERKFAHFAADADRTVLALAGRLHDFDVGVAANPTLYGSMPATLFPSPGTAVAATLLWVTSAQFTQLAWSELTYRLGRLRTRFELDEGDARFDAVLVFVSRFGTFCPRGEPAALAAIPAARRTAAELTEEQLLDAAAALALGPGARAETLIRAVFAAPDETLAKVAAAVHPTGQPLGSERWVLFS